MDKHEWKSRWNNGRIGFHLNHPNPNFFRYWDLIQEKKPSRVLVPLCGKTLDLLWLTRMVDEVVGIEVVEKATDDFFSENCITPKILNFQKMKQYSHKGLKIPLTDFSL